MLKVQYPKDGPITKTLMSVTKLYLMSCDRQFKHEFFLLVFVDIGTEPFVRKSKIALYQFYLQLFANNKSFI